MASRLQGYFWSKKCTGTNQLRKLRSCTKALFTRDELAREMLTKAVRCPRFDTGLPLGIRGFQPLFSFFFEGLFQPIELLVAISKTQVVLDAKHGTKHET